MEEEAAPDPELGPKKSTQLLLKLLLLTKGPVCPLTNWSTLGAQLVAMSIKLPSELPSASASKLNTKNPSTTLSAASRRTEMLLVLGHTRFVMTPPIWMPSAIWRVRARAVQKAAGAL